MQSAFPAPTGTTSAPLMIVDLDSPGADLVPWTPPVVVDGEIVTHPRSRGPLDAVDGVYPTALRGGIVTDPAEIAEIRARVAYGKSSWLRRLIARAPEGW